MDSLGDLMAFNSPPNKSVLPLSEQPEKQSLSPGSNPFDTLLKVATYTPAVNETNLLDVAFVEGATFVFTQTFSSETRNSLGVPNLIGEDCGKESLGILHINFNELSDKSGDDVFLKDTLSVQAPHKSSYHSFLKSISSRSSQSSQPSTIYSISPAFQSESNLFNFAMSPSLIEKHLRTANSVIVSPKRPNSVSCFETSHLGGFRRRISSVPSVLNKEKTYLHNKYSLQNSLDCSSQTPDEDKDGSMEDLAFVEIRHTAAKIADGSILEETSDSNMLDSTPAPKFDEIDNIPEETQQRDTEKLLKKLDRMLPNKLESSNKSNSKNSSNSSDNLKANCSQHSAKEAIQSLAEILNSENFNERRKTAGQHLLKSLAGILCSETNNSGDMSSLNDSGHSSIETEQEVQEKADCYEVLDLRKKSCSDSEVEQQAEAMDLSVGAKKLDVTPKSSIITRRTSISLKETNKTPGNLSGMVRRASESSLQSSKNQSNQTGSSNASGASLLISGPLTGKIKFKKISVSKTGPVKAVVGLTSKLATPKTPRTAAETSKFKKTSTPVNKSKIKPIAQSTPEESRANDVSKKKFEYSMSPLSRPVLTQHQQTTSDQNLLSDSSDQKLTRSNSATSIKHKNTSSLLAMRRSFSSGRGVGGGLKKPTETEKSKNCQRGKASDGNVSLNRSLYSRPFSLLSKLKKTTGKENVAH